MSLPLPNGAVLLPEPPDWSAGIDLSLQWQTKIVAGLTGLEERAGWRERPGAVLTWQVTGAGVAASASLATRIRRAIESGSAAVPCHSRPSQCVSATAGALTIAPTPWPWAAGDWLWIGEMAQARQVAGVEGDVLNLAEPLAARPAAGTLVYPLLFGALEVDGAGRQRADAHTARCRLHIPSWRVAAAAARVPYRGLPVAPEVLTSGANRRSRGDQGEELTASLGGEIELAAAESFLHGIGGRRDAFWLPGAEMAMVVKGPAASGFTIQAQGLADAWDAPGFLCFAHATLPPMAARIVAVSAGSDESTEVVTLEETLPATVDASWDVFRLRLVRLDDDGVRESAQANGVTALRIRTTELPPGSGAGMRAAFLYRFQARRDPARVITLTNHDAPVAYNGETYLPAAISHDDALAITGDRAALDLAGDDVIDVTLRRVDAAGGAETLLTGRVGRLTWVGQQIAAALLPPVDLTDRAVPAFRVGAACNHRLYGPGCGLDATAWSRAGVLAALAGANVTLAADPGKKDNWFAGGHLSAGPERRAILASAGAQLLLNGPLRQAQPGDAVTLFAGCTHLVAQCESRFNNVARFGGHPFIAEGQPGRPLPQFFGWQRLGAAAIAGAANWQADGVNHRADLVAAICRGPVDGVTHLWIDGRLVWSGELTRGSSASVDFAISGYGSVTLFWGTPDQAAQPDLARLGHPAYVGQCYLWMPQFLVGPDAAQIPRIEVALKRQPAVPWLAGAAANLNEDSNLATVLAAILTEPEFGAGMAENLFDHAQWLAAARRLAEEDTAASPVIDRAGTFGQLIEALCVYLDGFLHWTAEGKLQLILRREAPTDLSGRPALTPAHLAAFHLESRGETASRTTVTCVERERGWTPDDGQWQCDDAERTQTIALPWVTRRSVAARLARRFGKPPASPGLTGHVQVRRSAAAGITVGDWLTLDVGDGAGPVAVQCLRRRSPGDGAPTVDLEIASGRRGEDARELFDREDLIRYDAPRP